MNAPLQQETKGLSFQTLAMNQLLYQCLHVNEIGLLSKMIFETEAEGGNLQCCDGIVHKMVNHLIFLSLYLNV